MNATTLIYKNLLRNPMRSGLTVAAVALPMSLFVMTAAMRDVFDAVAEKSAQELRIGVHNKVSLINLMPSALRRQVEDLDPDGKVILTEPALDDPNRQVKAVCGLKWFGGKVPDSQIKYQFPSLAGDADTLPIIYSRETGMTAAEKKEWLALKNAAIVGPAVAKTYGWKQGDEVELKSSVPPYMNMRFKIVKVAVSALNPAIFYFRRDYLDDTLEKLDKEGKGPTGFGTINICWVKCKDAGKMANFAAAIDANFTNTPNETQTEDENTFIANFMKAGGDFPGKIQIVSYAVILAIVMVVANTMSLTFRERTREMAAIKAMGFRNFWLMRMMMGESLFLALVGGLIGILPLYLITQTHPLQIPNVPFPLRIPERTLTSAFAVVLMIGTLSGLLPAVQSVRLKVVDALRKVA